MASSVGRLMRRRASEATSYCCLVVVSVPPRSARGTAPPECQARASCRSRRSRQPSTFHPAQGSTVLCRRAAIAAESRPTLRPATTPRISETAARKSQIVPKRLNGTHSGHDHVDHHDGPATHDHHRPATSSDDGDSRLSSCDAAVHSIFLSVATTTAAAVFTVPFEAVELYVLAPDSARFCAVSPIDVRQHSPPGLTLLSPRAPAFFRAA